MKETREGAELFDNNEVVKSYRARRHQSDSPNEFLEKPVFLELLGQVSGRHILDLGCGDGIFGHEITGCGRPLAVPPGCFLDRIFKKDESWLRQQFQSVGLKYGSGAARRGRRPQLRGNPCNPRLKRNSISTVEAKGIGLKSMEIWVNLWLNIKDQPSRRTI